MTGAVFAKLKKVQYWVTGAPIVMVLVNAVYSHAQGKNKIPGFGDTKDIGI
jgi:hypothetical protein